MSKHTPGPWIVRGGKHGYEIQTPQPNDKFALTIVASQSTAYRTDEENDANARLIAAAPDLARDLKQAVAALSRIVDILDGTFTPGDESYAEEAYDIAKGHLSLMETALKAEGEDAHV